MTGREVVAPGPRAHLAGTRRLLARFAALAAGQGHAGLDPAVGALLGAAEGLPERVAREGVALKFDTYLAPHPGGLAWGVAVGDRWEAPAFADRAGRWLRETFGAEAAAAVDALAGALGAASGRSPARVVAVGFDAPGRPPRGKVYLQEDPWGEGVATAGVLRAALERVAPGCVVPGWLDDARPVGVVALELLPVGGRGVKLYLGGATPVESAAGAPPEAGELARRLAEASPLPGGYAYLTVRLRPGEAPRYSANRIYNVTQAAFTRGGEGLGAVWADVGGLFAVAGRGEVLDALRAGLREEPGLRVAPTATALDDTGGVDVYAAAWEVG